MTRCNRIQRQTHRDNMIKDNVLISAYKDEEEVCLQFSESVFRSMNKRVYPESCVPFTKLQSILPSGVVRVMASRDGRGDNDAHAVSSIMPGSDMPMLVRLSGT